MLRCTNTSPGSRPMISLAGTRLSEQPIHRYCGACWPTRRLKNPGSAATLPSAQARLLAFSSSSMRDAVASPAVRRKSGCLFATIDSLPLILAALDPATPGRVEGGPRQPSRKISRRVTCGEGWTFACGAGLDHGMDPVPDLSRSLKGLCVLVTGAASGMGRATATGFAREGAKVAVTDVRLEDAERVA